MAYEEWTREWFEDNYKKALRIPQEVFRRAILLTLIEGFAQMSVEYAPGKGSKACFREFVLKYSSLRDNLLLVCPVTLYYDYKDRYVLPQPDVFEGWIFDYTDPHLSKEAERLILCLLEKERETARQRHSYVSLLYQMRCKLVHEQRVQGTGIDFSNVPHVASGISSDVDDAGNIINTQVASLSIPEEFIAKLTWETIESYLDDCEREGRNPIPSNFSRRKCELSWYD